MRARRSPSRRLNAGGGVLGKKIELKTEDDQSKAGEPRERGEQADFERRCDGGAGRNGLDSRSPEAAPLCQENKIPMISPGLDATPR